MDFTGKVVVITGASSGIGEALVYAFADRGAKVVMGARNSAKLAEIAAQLFTRGIESAFEATDVTREEDCKRLIDKALSAFGRIDILICNAGISMRALFDDVQLDVLRQLMDVNFWGTVYCAKYALPALQAAKGTLVGVSSVAGMHGLPGRTGYSASKFAMTGLLETIRIENLKKGVHVMVACRVSPIERTLLGADRRRNQSGRITRNESKMMSAEEVAQRIIRGIERRKRTLLMEFDGRATSLIGKFAPGLLDRLFYNHMAKEPDSPFK